MATSASTHEGRKILIAGGASGFGRMIGQSFMRAGAQVVAADIDEAALRTLQSLEPLVHTSTLDVTDRAAAHRCVDRCAELLGGLDTLVYSVGVIHVKPFQEVTEAEWDRTINVNLKGLFLLAQACLPHLRESMRGRIVSIASDSGRRGFGWTQAYCASKFGLIGLSESLAAELASDGITVNCVCPGSCPETGMGKMLTEWKAERFGISAAEILQNIATSNPTGRSVTTNDVAAAVLFLASDAAGFITGMALDIDGGARLGQIPGFMS